MLDATIPASFNNQERPIKNATIRVEDAKNQDESDIDIDLRRRAPLIRIPKEIVDVDSQGGGRTDVLTIDVVSEKGTTRFFVDVHINNRGHAALTVATNKGNKSPSTKITGEWRPIGATIGGSWLDFPYS